MRDVYREVGREAFFRTSRGHPRGAGARDRGTGTVVGRVEIFRGIFFGPRMRSATAGWAVVLVPCPVMLAISFGESCERRVARREILVILVERGR